MSYTGKFTIGDTVVIANGNKGEVAAINPAKSSHNYAVKFQHLRQLWYSEEELVKFEPPQFYTRWRQHEPHHR